MLRVKGVSGTNPDNFKDNLDEALSHIPSDKLIKVIDKTTISVNYTRYVAYVMYRE